MPTIVVMKKGSVVRRVALVGAIFVAGWCIGALMAANKGAAIASERYQNNFVSLKEYYRLCDEYEKIGEMYWAERKRNVLATGSHDSPMKAGKKAPLALPRSGQVMTVTP